MRGFAQQLAAICFAITSIISFGFISEGFHVIDACADDGDNGIYRNNNTNLESISHLDIAIRFNIEVEEIDCESNFSKPSFGKAYHKLGSAQDYCRAIKLDEVPDYHIRKTDSIHGSTNAIWSIGVISILCFWLLIVLMIIRGGSIFFKDSWETEFNNSNEI